MKKKKKEPFRIGVMDIILVLCVISIAYFTHEMIEIFKMYGAVPDVLIGAVFACVTGELGIMGRIQTTKEKNRQRKEDLEDRQHMEDREDQLRKEEKENSNGTDRNDQRTEDLEFFEEQGTE